MSRKKVVAILLACVLVIAVLAASLVHTQMKYKKLGTAILSNLPYGALRASDWLHSAVEQDDPQGLANAETILRELSEFCQSRVLQTMGISVRYIHSQPVFDFLADQIQSGDRETLEAVMQILQEFARPFGVTLDNYLEADMNHLNSKIINQAFKTIADDTERIFASAGNDF